MICCRLPVERLNEKLSAKLSGMSRHGEQVDDAANSRLLPTRIAGSGGGNRHAARGL